MRGFRVNSAIVLALLGFRVIAGGASGNVLADNANDANPVLPPVTANVQYEGGPGLMPTYVAYLTCGTNKFGFVLPEGFRLSLSDSNKVILVSADLNSLINWRIAGPVPSNGTELDPAEYRAMLMKRHPGGKIIAEFSQAAGGHRGPAFEVRWSGSGGLERQELAVFVPSPAGVVEFDLVSSLEKYGTARQQMSAAMLTFRWSDEHGKLVMPRFSNML